LQALRELPVTITGCLLLAKCINSGPPTAGYTPACNIRWPSSIAFIRCSEASSVLVGIDRLIRRDLALFVHLIGVLPHWLGALGRDHRPEIIRTSNSSADCRADLVTRHIDRSLLRASLSRQPRDLVTVVEVHSSLRSAGTSPNFRITFASPNSPVAGSPLRLNASAPM
jgi:hypothetical protein